MPGPMDSMCFSIRFYVANHLRPSKTWRVWVQSCFTTRHLHALQVDSGIGQDCE